MMKRKTFLSLVLSLLACVSARADFVIDGRVVVEVGGGSKDGTQIAGNENAFLACDGIEYPFGNKLPLWLFGMIY